MASQGPRGPTGDLAVKTAGASLACVRISLLFLFRAPVAGEGRVWGGGCPSHQPETALCLFPLLSSPASHPLSLLLNLLLPPPAPSGIPSCSPCFLSPPWAGKENKRPQGQFQAPQSPQGLVPLATCLAFSLLGWGLGRSAGLSPGPAVSQHPALGLSPEPEASA